MIRFAAFFLLLMAAAPLAAQDARFNDRAAMSRFKGNQNANVVVFEFADFQCPYCARFAREIFPRIDSAYVRTGKIQWIFVNMPLPNHPHAWAASEAAMCAGAVSEKFWPMHDRLFNAQAEWTAAADPAAHMQRYARDAGVAVEGFQACVQSDRTAALLVRDVMYATNARVSGTPAFMINNDTVFVGMKSFEEWRELLEAALKRPRQ
ncbi:MAG TPA: thioredoxin domain-containing protein [Longimicrobiales bacterium]